MKSKRSARLRFAAAIWIVLSVAVFGTLIGVAWMSMNARADVSTGSPIHEAVDDKTTTQDVAREINSSGSHSIPLATIGWEQRLFGYSREPY